MASGGPTRFQIRLTPETRRLLKSWQRSRSVSAIQARRGRFILCVADGMTIAGAARHVETTRSVGYRWLRRWTKKGLDGLRDISAEDRRQLSLPFAMMS